MDWLISSAQAQTATGATGSNGGMLLFMAVFAAFFYFVLIRPQTKRAKEQRALIASIEVGAEVVTQGGVLGKVTEAGEQFLTVEIADNVQVKVQRHTIAHVLPKGTIKAA